MKHKKTLFHLNRVFLAIPLCKPLTSENRYHLNSKKQACHLGLCPGQKTHCYGGLKLYSHLGLSVLVFLYQLGD